MAEIPPPSLPPSVSLSSNGLLESSRVWPLPLSLRTLLLPLGSTIAATVVFSSIVCFPFFVVSSVHTDSGSLLHTSTHRVSFVLAAF